MAWNLIERGIAGLSPGWALRRASMRAQLDLVRGYEAAAGGRRQSSWSRPSTSASAEVARAGTLLRNTGRELVRNNPYAKKAKRIYVANMVGSGIMPTPDTGQKLRDKKISERFEIWCAQADLAGRLNYFALQAQAAGALFESGEVLCRLRDLAPGPALRLQLLEADFLDTSRFTVSSGTGTYTDGGIEYDETDRPLAYWLHRQHPGDASLALRGRLDAIRVPASDMLHVFAAHMGRPGQNRGVSEYAAVSQRLADLAEYDEATLVGKKIAACFAAFVKRGANSGTPLAGGLASTDADGRRLETLAPGMIQYLGSEEEITFASPPESGGHREYTVGQLHAVAAGLGVSYEHLAADMSQVNYTSHRAGQIDFRRGVEMDQWLMLEPMFCTPIWRAFIDREVMAGHVRPSADGAHYRVNHSMPKFESVDPGKDAAADREEMRNGTLPLFDAIARRGENPQRVLQAHAEAAALLDSLGLVLDSDPRKTTRSGAAMAPAKPADAADAKESDDAADPEA